MSVITGNFGNSLCSPFRFAIINFCKPDSLYNHGMKPLMYSEKMALEEKIGWRRTGDDVTYYKTEDTWANQIKELYIHTLGGAKSLFWHCLPKYCVCERIAQHCNELRVYTRLISVEQLISKSSFQKSYQVISIYFSTISKLLVMDAIIHRLTQKSLTEKE